MKQALTVFRGAHPSRASFSGSAVLLNTRRRMLGLLAAAIGDAAPLVQLIPSAFAARDRADRASKKPAVLRAADLRRLEGDSNYNKQAGARIGQITFSDPDACDLRAEFQVAASYDAKLVIFGDPDGTALPKEFLVNPDNRIIAKNEDGTTPSTSRSAGCASTSVTTRCNVLPLSTGALFRWPSRWRWR